ncbi:MAG: hypothetical protein I3J02_07840 [Prevotella sp.]|nr:hypothetical protein [Prevotella sp.]
MKRLYSLCVVLFVLLMIPLSSRATDYYLVGDWNSWSLTSATFKFQPVYDQPGVYSLYVNAPLNAKTTYALRFVINPSDNTSDWSKVIRPTNSGSDYVVNNTDVSATAGYIMDGTAAWQLVANMSARNNANNGGSYLVTLDMTDPSSPQWSIKSTPDVRVLYFLSSGNSYSFSGDYLVDTNQYPNNYNNNYSGLVTMTTGMTYKLSDGYHWFGSTTDNIAYNGASTTTTQSVQENDTGGTENVPYNGESGTYALEANVLGLNDAGTIDFSSAPRKDVIIRPSTSDTQATHVYFKGGSVTTDTEMTYDPATRIWSMTGIALANSDATTFTEKFYNGNGFDETASNLDNDAQGAGTYKAVYVSKYESGTGEPVCKLLQSQTTTLIDGKLMRTYSDYYARIIPTGLSAYYATAYDATSHVLTMTSLTDSIIPANTGVLLVCEPTATGIHFDDRYNASNVKIGNVISMEKATAAGTAPTTNYLVAEQTELSLGPVTRDANGNVAFRNYYFAYKDLDGDGSQTLGFYRCLQNSPTGNIIRKAYLALSATLQPDSSLDGVSYTDAAKAMGLSSATSDNTSNNVSAAQMVKMLFDGVDLLGYGVAAGINIVTQERSASTDNRYYNLQGIEVARPTKGIFIHNGKKVIIE